MSFHSTRGRLGLAIGALGATALVLAGCATSSTGGGGRPRILRQHDHRRHDRQGHDLDPAGSYDNGSLAVMNQIYPYLMNSKYGTAEVTPDIAESAEFTSPTEYTVKLKKGLKFANGDPLTSRREVLLRPHGQDRRPQRPVELLYNLDSVAAPDPRPSSSS
jgi:peptide/nickel transport system substrate-binding protein